MSLVLPSAIFPTPGILSTYSPFSIGQIMRLNAGAATAALAWGTANQARYTPFWVTDDATLVKLAVYCGSTGGGNNDMGLYDENGTEIVGGTAAAHPAATGWHEFDVADTPLRPGMYYVGLLNTTTTATFLAWANKEFGRAAGVFSQAVGSGNLPNPATFAALDAAVVPVVAMAFRTLL